MKKRKIFVGLLLGAAVFSLAACTGTSDNSTTSSGTTPATSTTSTDGTQGTSSTTTTTTSAAAKEKFTVKYYSVIGDDTAEITAAQQEVEEGSTTTAPEAKLAKDGYKIAGYYTNDGLGEEFDFTKAITKNAKVYVAYEELTLFDTLATSQNKVVAYDFDEPVTIDTSTTEFGSTTPTLKASGASDTVQENKQISLKKNNFCVDFGQKFGAGVLTVYFEITPKAVKTKECWLQFNGDSASGSGTEVIGFRTDGNSKLAYRIDASSTDITSANAPSIAANTKICVLATINLAEGKMTVTADDTVIYDNVDITATAIRGLKFTAKSDLTSFKYLDNIAVTFEAKTATPLIAAKTETLALTDAYKDTDAYKNLDADIKKVVDGDISDFRREVNNATTVDKVSEMKSAWESYLTAPKFSVPVKAYTAASTAATGVDDYKVIVTFTEPTYNSYLLTKVSFDGYTVDGLYKDAALTQSIANEDIISGATFYAKVTKLEELSTYTFNVSDITATTDQDTFAAGNHQFGTQNAFTLVSDGAACQRVKNDAVYAIELGKNLTNYIKVTLRAGATITVNAGSTGSANTTSGFGVYTDVSTKTLASGTEAKSVTGNNNGPGEALTFTIASAGTYYIGYTESSRAGRIFSITINY